MNNWFMLALVGKDQPGIVAEVTHVLYEMKGNLGETSMVRLGGNFTIMLMVCIPEEKGLIYEKLKPVCDKLGLLFHLDEIDAALHQHIEADVRISIHGADQAGIVASATDVLYKAGFNILNLESDVGGNPQSPVYIMHIEGVAGKSYDDIEKALQRLAQENDVVARMTPIDTMLG